MPEAALEKEAAAVQPTHEGIHLVSRLTDAVDDGIALAKQVGKHTSDAAEELMDDTTQRIRRHPTETLVGAFALGVVAGGFLDWLIRRK